MKRRQAFSVLAGLGLSTFGLAGCGGGGGGLPDPTQAPNSNSDPAQARIETGDLERFAAVFRAESPGFADLQNRLQTAYLDVGSPGLKAFASSRIGSAAQLAQTIRAVPEFYAQSLPQMLRLGSDPQVAARIRAAFADLKARLPEVVFPPTYFVVGRLNTGGTVSAEGILIGAEFFGDGPGVAALAPSRFVRDNLHPPQEAALLVAHELVHVLQLRAGGLQAKSNRTLLDQALLEGSADFIGALISGASYNRFLADWADPREAQVWAEFRAEMNGTDTSRWLRNQTESSGDRPGDLAYYVGMRITQAYYLRQADKSQALRDIIGMKDGAPFLEASAYAAKFSA